MPAEWESHRRCWMAWPCNPKIWGDGLADAREAYVNVAWAIAEHEPVTMVTREDSVAEASLALGQGSGVAVLPMSHDDAWMRDIGPTFVVDDEGEVAGVDWRFNGWGEVQPTHDADATVAARILDHLSRQRIESDLTTEGGAIHTDGAGTLLLCETSVLDPQRNPDWDRARVEAELARTLGARKVIWLPVGLTDDETRGHIDNLACFTAKGKVLALDPDTASGLDRQALEANLECLRDARDANNEPLEVTLLPVPKSGRRHNGSLLTKSYVNFYLANGTVVVPQFDDPADQGAARTIAAAFPDRTLVTVDALAILEGGGGIHCITQQQPGKPPG